MEDPNEWDEIDKQIEEEDRKKRWVESDKIFEIIARYTLDVQKEWSV